MKYLKWILGIIFLILLLLVIGVRIAYHEKKPTIIENADAEAMASNMLSAINVSAWDTLPYISWSFRGSHHFVWDKQNNRALVQWDDYTVHLNPDQVQGRAYKGDQLLEAKESDKAVKKAWGYWCNDMFWLAAPFKIRDNGVQLNVAKDKDGKEGLLVSYSSGGVTPGDSYLWFLDGNGLPTGYKMWVKIIPIGGVYTSWEDWKTLEGGARVAGMHQGNISALSIPITNIKAGDSWSDLGYDRSPINL